MYFYPHIIKLSLSEGLVVSFNNKSLKFLFIFLKYKTYCQIQDMITEEDCMGSKDAQSY